MTYRDLMTELAAKAAAEPDRRITPFEILATVDARLAVVLDEYLGAMSLWGPPVVRDDATMLLVLLNIPY